VPQRSRVLHRLHLISQGSTLTHFPIPGPVAQAWKPCGLPDGFRVAERASPALRVHRQTIPKGSSTGFPPPRPAAGKRVAFPTTAPSCYLSITVIECQRPGAHATGARRIPPILWQALGGQVPPLIPPTTVAHRPPRKGWGPLGDWSETPNRSDQYWSRWVGSIHGRPHCQGHDRGVFPWRDLGEGEPTVPPTVPGRLTIKAPVSTGGSLMTWLPCIIT
jgi:hypothetical protein